MLHLLHAALLGIIQGITELLPISSTAHLFLAQSWFGLSEDTFGLTFDMFINIGTVVAIVSYFRKELAELIGNTRTLLWILLATIPAGVAGLLFENVIDSDLRNLTVVAGSLIVVGIIMLVAEQYYAQLKKHEPVATGPTVLSMGVAQALALIPGVSRSGITITAGLFSKLDRVAAARVSFLLSVPITSAAILKRLIPFIKEINTGTVPSDVLAFYIVGLITAWLSGYLTLRFLMPFYRKISLRPFAYYRIALGIFLLVLIAY